MCTHNLCFEQKYENCQKRSTENCHFYSCEKLLYVAWACFRNDVYEKPSSLIGFTYFSGGVISSSIKPLMG